MHAFSFTSAASLSSTGPLLSPYCRICWKHPFCATLLSSRFTPRPYKCPRPITLGRVGPRPRLPTSPPPSRHNNLCHSQDHTARRVRDLFIRRDGFYRAGNTAEKSVYTACWGLLSVSDPLALPPRGWGWTWLLSVPLMLHAHFLSPCDYSFSASRLFGTGFSSWDNQLISVCSIGLKRPVEGRCLGLTPVLVSRGYYTHTRLRL